MMSASECRRYSNTIICPRLSHSNKPKDMVLNDNTFNAFLGWTFGRFIGQYVRMSPMQTISPMMGMSNRLRSTKYQMGMKRHVPIKKKGNISPNKGRKVC